MMKGFIVSSRGKCLREIDFMPETNVYKAILTLRMITGYYKPKHDSEYYISIDDILPITLFGDESDEEEHSKTSLVLSKVDSVEESLWFLENCEEEYEGEKLCNHSIEEIYYGYDNNIETHGVIYKMKLDNGIFVSIREVYKQ